MSVIPLFKFKTGDRARLGSSEVQVLSCDGETAEVMGQGPFGMPWLLPCLVRSLRPVRDDDLTPCA